LWQWLSYEAPQSNGAKFTPELFNRLFETEVHALADVPHIEEAAALFRKMVTADEFEEFLTFPAYKLLN
jgi:malate synthase